MAVAIGSAPMTHSLRIAVADDEPDVREYLQKVLLRLGHNVVGAAQTGRALIVLCKSTQPDLIISDIKMPDMDGIDAATEIYKERPIPVILVSAFHDAELIARAEADHVMGYLVKPIKQADLVPAIALATRRFEQFKALQQETADLKQALEDRKIIEKAKGLLMKRANMDEPEAFRNLQKMASDKNRKLVDIAQMILVTEELLSSPKTNKCPSQYGDRTPEY
jgi:two-component system, response regulator PdtaR